MGGDPAASTSEHSAETNGLTTGVAILVDKVREGIDLVGGAVSEHAGDLMEKMRPLADGIGPISQIACGVGLLIEIPRLPGKASEMFEEVRNAVRAGSINEATIAGSDFARDAARLALCAIENLEHLASLGAAATAAVSSASVVETLANGASAAAALAANTPPIAALAQAVTGGALQAAGTAIAEGAARFVPALNVVVAAADVAYAASVLRNPKASGLKKTFAAIAAIGSVAMATNLPILSQAGAIVSAAGFVAGAFVKK